MPETIEASSLDADSAPVLPAKSLFQSGATCWRIERAGRFAQIVDAIESLARPGRGLVPLKTPEHAAVLELLADTDFTLPEKPRRYWTMPSRKRRYLS